MTAGNKYIINIESFKYLKKSISIYLEYCQSSLAEMCPIVDTLIIQYFTDICRGVEYCHRHNIIHRDLKPENIVFDGINMKLIDFGISVLYSNHNPPLDPNMAAYLHYRAPETFIHGVAYNSKIDIWALGMILFFMHSGKVLLDDCVEESFKIKLFNIFGIMPKWRSHNFFANYPDATKQKETWAATLGKYSNIMLSCLEVNPIERIDIIDLLKLIEL